MLTWISALYSKPTAQVRINEMLSVPFPISNGTRQGCPLSPFIFVLVLEPFFCTIRNNPNIRGLAFWHVPEQKIAAFADDLLFFLTSPITSLPNLMYEFNRYSHLANFKIYFNKSEALNISLTPHTYETLMSNFPFKWAASPIKYLYLGTQIPKQLSQV